MIAPGDTDGRPEAAPDDDQRRRFLEDVIAGLSSSPKRIPSKYFYDERGSRLFDEICELPEYYVTRTELAIMEAHAAEMARACGRGSMLLEFGSGSSVKTRLLLDNLEEPVAYVPIDISCEHLVRAAEEIACDYPHVPVVPVCADFTRRFEIPEVPRRPARRVVYFPGSTIGNFDKAKAVELMRWVAELCGPGGLFLVGADLEKDAAVLERAYNDASGVTAAFNSNLLERMRRELGAEIDTAAFEHKAVWDPHHGRIEMRLVSTRAQTARVGEQTFSFAAGDEIVTEHSHKYPPERFAGMAESAGFHLVERWTDPADLFAVFAFEA